MSEETQSGGSEGSLQKVHGWETMNTFLCPHCHMPVFVRQKTEIEAPKSIVTYDRMPVPPHDGSPVRSMEERMEAGEVQFLRRRAAAQRERDLDATGQDQEAFESD